LSLCKKSFGALRQSRLKLPPNDDLWHATAAWQNWRLPPCRIDDAA
jgi:hypothetical protein